MPIGISFNHYKPEEIVFAESICFELFGEVSKKFDCVKILKRILKSMDKQEDRYVLAYFNGTCFYPKDKQSLENRVKNSIRTWIKKHNKNNIDAFLFCGFTFEQLERHIESQFAYGMSWENWGDWHIDHIRPIKSIKTEEDRIEVFSLKNLRPLWRLDNLKKGSKWQKN